MTYSEIETPGLRRCSRVRGERTLQFYAVRNQWNWLLGKKTRDPVDFMKERWGQDIDVITLLACEAHEVNRDYKRYESQYEVVDCGRNKKKANDILTALKDEVDSERRLQKMAERDIEAEIVDAWKHEVDTAEGHRKGMSRMVQEEGLLALLSDWEFDDRAKEVVIAEIAQFGLDELKNAAEETEEGINTVLLKMKALVVDRSVNYEPAIDGVKAHGKFIQQHYADDARDKVDAWLGELRRVTRARKKLADRRASVKKTAEQLSKLGFAP